MGWWLFRRGTIGFDPALGLPTALRDTVILTFTMDVAMYLGHRVTHHRSVYPYVHLLHHRFRLTRPATLFAMHPPEVLGFGGMWLVTLVVLTSLGLALSALGVGVYVMLNLAFGTLGHVGVEPLPDRWRSARAFRWITTPSFHIGHHLDERHNLGFYTTLWDRLFGTLAPSYDELRVSPLV